MSLEEILNSGILESYVIGDVTEAEVLVVEKAIKELPEVGRELTMIEDALEGYAYEYAKEPDPTIGPMLIATINYTKRLESGEIPVEVPDLHLGSTVSDYSQWIDRPDLSEPDTYGGMHGYIIGNTEDKTTLIVWLRDGAPDETHTDEHETFLIVEGTCNIVVGDKVNSLKAGDVFTIPLHINHRVEVTSQERCKVILERKAA